MKRFGIIYKITNKINGKIYIGQTIHTSKMRFNAHCREVRHGMAITTAIIKYGRENFEVEDLLSCSSQKSLDQYEVELIKYYNSIAPNGYNLCGGGANKKTISEETRKKLSDSHKGHTHNRGRVHSLEYKLNIAKRKTGKLRPIVGMPCYTTRATIYLFVNETEQYGFNQSDVRRVLKGERPHCKGHVFYYYDEFMAQANQSGRRKIKILRHAQRLESEPENTQNNDSTSLPPPSDRKKR